MKHEVTKTTKVPLFNKVIFTQIKYVINIKNMNNNNCSRNIREKQD